MAFQIIRNDITKVKADAIVNTANPKPKYVSGVDYAIYTAAGAEKLLAERQKIGDIAPGQAAETPAFALPAKYIIHTVGPAWIDGKHGETDVLRECYSNSLQLAQKLGCESIAFPLIATGVEGFPKSDALQIAVKVIVEFLANADMEITLVVFDETSFVLSGGLFAGVDAFIDDNYATERFETEYGQGMAARMSADVSGAKAGDAVGFAASAVSQGSDSAEEEVNKRRRSLFASGLFRRKKRGGKASPPCEDAAMPRREEAKTKPQEEPEESFEEALEEAAEESYEEAVEETADLCEEDAEEMLDDEVSHEKVFEEAESPLHEKRETEAFSGAALDEGNRSTGPAFAFRPMAEAAKPKRTLDDLMKHVSETWAESLLRMIDERGYTDTEVYKRANVDRKLFSKIRSNANYQPKKITAMAFALALRLSLDETKDFLRRAGYALSPSSRFDLIVEYFIEQEVYDTYTINLALFDHNQPLLGV